MSFLSAIGGVASSGASSTASGNSSAKALGTAGSDFDAILARLKKLGSETPAERARDHVLKKHKLSEDEYQKLPQDKRDAIDKEIVAMTRDILQRQAEAQKKVRIG